ncbi:hypothetical protein [Streptomyces sp. NBC_01233]|uniref:hypothetical protein n=1 Tax=Streptomyces sp. NBC_01233 TaxID=2903787 RepID=UPI002E0E5164|nr:hypothetical protein OG332_23895 [Streptomyces sp. NBC_01233]
MAACCGVPRCSCSVIAGPGVTVDGNGSAAAPYTITVDPVPTAIQAGDTATVDNTVTGTGTAGDPYVLTSDVILDPAPPGGGTNLLASGPDGLYVECAQVRTCFTGGDGIAYDEATGEIAALLSADAGNTTVFGTDGGLYTPAASTALQAADSPSVDVTVSGTGAAGDPYEVSAVVILDPAPPGGGSNLLESGPDGLYVECADVRTCFTAGDGIAYDPATGEIAAQLSADAGNTTVFGTDGGLYTPAASTALQAADSPTVDVTVTGTGAAGDPYEVAAAVILDPAPPGGGSNLLEAGADGLYVECADVRTCFTAGDGIDYDPATGEIAAQLSTDAGNTVAFGTDGGLYVPPGSGTALQGGDTPTASNTVTGTGAAGDPYVVSTDVVLDPAPPGGGSNLLEAGPDGLYVECADVRTCFTAGDGAAYTAGTGEIEARLSTDAGNLVEFGTDGGLFVPPTEVGCGLQGAGTTASPFSVFPVAGERPWADDWACDATLYSTLHCDPDTGALWTPPDHYSAMDQIYVEHFAGGFLTPIGPTGGWVIIDPGANQQFNIPANFLGNQCRTWGYEITNSGTWDIEHNATAVFEVGLVVQQDGGPLQVRPLWGHLTAVGQAHRERGNGTANEALWNIPAASGASCIMWPAINVSAGQVTAIHSWISDATIDTQTNTP